MVLGEATIKAKLQELSGDWQRQGQRLVLHGKFNNFVDAMAFAQAITPLAEAQGHHPDLEIGWGRCTVLLTTHDDGGSLTEKDFNLAKAIDQIR